MKIDRSGRKRWLRGVAAGVLLVAGGSVCAADRVQKPAAGAVPMQAATVGTITATPTTITFTLTDPDAGPVAGSSNATLYWSVTNPTGTTKWTLSVNGGSSSFGSCPTVPVSAVTATCAWVFVLGGGSGTCGSSIPLSTTSQQIASGNEGSFYIVALSFQLAESWRYIASNSCSLTLTYTVYAP